MSVKSVLNLIPAVEQFEGAGAIVRRAIGVSRGYFNPFLMFDHFRAGNDGNGFPHHPHRGQETISLMLKGAIAHEDFTGSKGILYAGDLQFMTAGRGIVHSEMPVNTRGETAEGLQLWVDLPQHLRDCKPRYRDLREWEVPSTTEGNLTVHVISGQYKDLVSEKDLAYTPIQYYHVKMTGPARYEQPLPRQYNSFLYVLKGRVTINDTHTVSEFTAATFGNDGDQIRVDASGTGPAEFVVISGEILDQQTTQYGPFVASNNQGLEQAVMDYQRNQNGFEPKLSWKSLISDGVTQDMIENELDGNWEKRMATKKAYLAKQSA